MNLFEDTYLTITKSGEGLFRDRGSKFLGFSFPVCSEEEVKKHLLRLKKEHVGANHCCYAFRIGPDKQFFRMNDDGEPSGTAGRPILGQIQSRDLTNVMVAVVRYFGGTLLGVSGLINAYKQAAVAALDDSIVIEKTVNEYYQLRFDYDSMNAVMKIIKDNELGQSNQDFGLECKLDIAIRKNNAESIVTLFRKISGLTVTFLKTE
jgi:uncharacterized YigZ family protein